MCINVVPFRERHLKVLLFIAVAYLSINMGNIWLKQVFFGGASGVKGHNAEIAPQLYYCGRTFILVVLMHWLGRWCGRSARGVGTRWVLVGGVDYRMGGGIDDE